jgi:hypothetical protein
MANVRSVALTAFEGGRRKREMVDTAWLLLAW